MGTLFAADRGLIPKGGTNRRGRVGAAGSDISPTTEKSTTIAVGGRNGGADPPSASVITSRLTPVQDERSLGSGSVDLLGSSGHVTSSNAVPLIEPNMAVLSTALSQVVQEAGPLTKEIGRPTSNTPPPALPPDLQVKIFLF